MTDTAVHPLEELARSDPVVAPLALLQAEAMRAAAEPFWGRAAPALERSSSEHGLEHGRPLLHGKTIELDPGPVRALFVRLAEVVARYDVAGAATLRRALASAELAALPALEASIALDTARLELLAQEARADAALLSTLGQVATIPLLQACRQQAKHLLEGVAWGTGYCPVCAAWPTLAELRGMERRLWLRCGRCGAGWPFHHQRCVFCGNDDHRSLGYLAAESDREARRVVTCGQCHGYFKTMTTLGALAPTEILVQDIATVELDVAALERGYARPQTPGIPLALTLEPAQRHDAR